MKYNIVSVNKKITSHPIYGIVNLKIGQSRSDFVTEDMRRN